MEPHFFNEVTQLDKIPELQGCNIPRDRNLVFGTTDVTTPIFSTRLIGECRIHARRRLEFWLEQGFDARMLNLRPFKGGTDCLANATDYENGENAIHSVVELMQGVVISPVNGKPATARLIDDPTYCAEHPPMRIYEYAENLAEAVYGLRIGKDCSHVREWTDDGSYEGELQLY